MITRFLTIALSLALCGSGAMAQPSPYRASADTLYYTILNQRTTAFVRGRDTLRTSTVNFVLKAERWAAIDDARLRVVVRTMCLNLQRCTAEDTLDVTPRGQLVAIGGRSPDATAAALHDFLLHLPDAKLKPGVQWTDSLSLSTPGAGGGTSASSHSTYRVTHVEDGAGNVRVADITSDGSLHYRESYWIDSAAGQYGWVDVTGPAHEEFFYDLTDGQLLTHQLTATLSGWGTLPNRSGGVDTVPTIEKVHILRRTVDVARAQVMARMLPGQDSSVTVDSLQHVFSLHTVRRTADATEAGMVRADGWVRTAGARFAGGRPLSYDAVWTDTSIVGKLVRHVERRGDSLLVRAGPRDTIFGVPAVTWAIADEAMPEFLVPALLTLPHDSTEHPLAIFRTYSRRWEVWHARMWETAGMYAAVLTFGARDIPQYLLMTRDGDLLMVGVGKWIRLPRAGSARASVLQQALRQIQRKEGVKIGLKGT